MATQLPFSLFENEAKKQLGEKWRNYRQPHAHAHPHAQPGLATAYNDNDLPLSVQNSKPVYTNPNVNEFGGNKNSMFTNSNEFEQLHLQHPVGMGPQFDSQTYNQHAAY